MGIYVYGMKELVSELDDFLDGIQGDFNKADLTITLGNGATAICAGLDDHEKLKSIAGITGIWGEEAGAYSDADVRQSPLALKRAVTLAERRVLDHLVLFHNMTGA